MFLLYQLRDPSNVQVRIRIRVYPIQWILLAQFLEHLGPQIPPGFQHLHRLLLMLARVEVPGSGSPHAPGRSGGQTRIPGSGRIHVHPGRRATPQPRRRHRLNFVQLQLPERRHHVAHGHRRHRRRLRRRGLREGEASRGPVVRLRRAGAQDAELVRRVGEEAHAPLAVHAVLARLRAVAGRVEPALEDAVGELAGVAPVAVATAEIGAGVAGVVELPRVAAAGLLPRVGERALRPVVRPPACALTHLKLEHPEIIA